MNISWIKRATLQLIIIWQKNIIRWAYRWDSNIKKSIQVKNFHDRLSWNTQTFWKSTIRICLHWNNVLPQQVHNRVPYHITFRDHESHWNKGHMPQPPLNSTDSAKIPHTIPFICMWTYKSIYVSHTCYVYSHTFPSDARRSHHDICAQHALNTHTSHCRRYMLRQVEPDPLQTHKHYTHTHTCSPKHRWRARARSTNACEFACRSRRCRRKHASHVAVNIYVSYSRCAHFDTGSSGTTRTRARRVCARRVVHLRLSRLSSGWPRCVYIVEWFRFSSLSTNLLFRSSITSA